MIYRTFGKMGWKVSAVGMGTWNISNQWGEMDDATAYATVLAAFDSGANLFDTAESYGIPHGLAEQRLGRALAGIRHQVYVVTKVGYFGVRTGQTVPKTTVDMVRLCCHACLGRLRTDWIDVLLCHVNDLEDPSVYLEGFEALKEEGRIRAYGISTDRLDVLKRFNSADTCAVVQVDYSLLNRAPEAEFLPYCMEHGIAVLVRGPLCMGILAGNYSTDTVFTDSIRNGWNDGGDPNSRSWFLENLKKVERLKQSACASEEIGTQALRFAISHPAAPVAIPGAKTPEQARMNTVAGDRILTQDEIAKLVGLFDG